jgi:soluble P-type ATPase
MISVTIPGDTRYELEHIVLDYNGTLAVDGKPAPDVHALLNQLSHEARIHVVTADTFGIVKTEMQGVNCSLTVLPAANQDVEKLRYVQALGAEGVAAIGNGRNDQSMLKEAALSIAIIGHEGAFGGTAAVADIICVSITDALELLLRRKRLIATLRR